MCVDGNNTFCSKKDLQAHCTKKAHTTADLECGDGDKYCALDGQQEDYVWEDEDLTLEELEAQAAAPATAVEPPATTTDVPVVLVTAAGNSVS